MCMTVSTEREDNTDNLSTTLRRHRSRRRLDQPTVELELVRVQLTQSSEFGILGVWPWRQVFFVPDFLLARCCLL